jgi:L-ascorbate metabolism protein UlaG (beta-lactamase superfamily)
MKLFGELWDLDLAVLPVGDRFTMGPVHAARAVELLRPRHVIPCHYGTFPIILPDAGEFVRLVGSTASVHALSPGETLDLD